MAYYKVNARAISPVQMTAASDFVVKMRESDGAKLPSCTWYFNEEETMPSSWSNKEERMYDHVKDSEKDKGASTDRAKEIAARTVNKHRREEGETSNKTTQGT